MIRKLVKVGSICAAVVIIAIGLLLLIPSCRHNAKIAFTKAIIYITPAPNTPFPKIDTKGLMPVQIKILRIARQEYAKHPVSYDATVLKYTQGAKEAWCANFVSWVMKQSGTSYSNPNSASWRIPGVITLQEYYLSRKRYEDAGHYRPKPGDVAFFLHKSTFRLFRTEHVALVIEVDGDQMTTLGGNEHRIMRIDTQTINAGDNNLVGFGRL